MYYLQSRYYDPTTCRFINADAYASTGQGVLGYNMFAYCLNNPESGEDPRGTCFHRWDFWNNCKKCAKKLKSLKKDVKNFLSDACKVAGAFAENFEFSIGIGLGFYRAGNIFDCGVEGGVKGDIIHVKYEDKNWSIGRTASTALFISFGIFDIGICDDHFVDNSDNQEYDYSWYWVNDEKDSWSLFEVGGYLLAGASLRIGYALNSFLKDLDQIFSD